MCESVATSVTQIAGDAAASGTVNSLDLKLGTQSRLCNRLSITGWLLAIPFRTYYYYCSRGQSDLCETASPRKSEGVANRRGRPIPTGILALMS